ncbi:MAG TPA: aminotransferase class III-fold pyridoxal phosphate-dependent enzyme [Steroidobacteraceae bacterium]|nr:aminotransferase class III-fold pyridoxal phosphate-dependent enzyme [Steroidobacteraceae bacterium]
MNDQDLRASLSLRERDARVIANIGRLRFSPLSVIGGSGNRLIEEGGRHVLDLSASCGPAILGYSHPALTSAVTEACASMAGASLLAYPNENAVALAEELLRLTPGRGERRVWFGHSGSDANDCIMRVLQAASGRSRFISFIGSYHGNLSGSISGHTAMTHTLPRAGLVLWHRHCYDKCNGAADQLRSHTSHARCAGACSGGHV